MDDALAGHLVDQRNGLLQGVFGASQIVLVNGRPDIPQRTAQVRTELAIVLTVLDTLPVRLERGCMLGHVIYYLRNSQS